MAAVNHNRKFFLLLLLRVRIKERRRIRDISKYKKRFWIQRLFAERKLKGEYHLLLKDMKLFGHDYFFQQFRMLPTQLEALLHWVAPSILK